MRERLYVCVNCWREYPGDWGEGDCANCGYSLVPKSGGIRKSFAVPFSLVFLLWVGTPIVIGIGESVTANPSQYGSLASVVVGSGFWFILYSLAGGIAGGLMLLFRRARTIGAGILAGTGFGLLVGFVTCFTVGGVVA